MFTSHVRYFFFLMIRRPPRSTQSRSSAASDVYKRQAKASEILTEEEVVASCRTNNAVPRIKTHGVANDRLIPLANRVLYTAAQRNLLFFLTNPYSCLLYTSPSPRDRTRSRMPSSA
eukprot:TRINITY_DN22587_c0_g1_i1.p1 TRINITY_DN22587_c0_g1~~TRINITY_DN22587_c0_g1_i1.p1  ORF type:complete len:117 (-),score=55.43 TRINITY_DN22587_c0_g1_i1:77-427(-)